VAIDNSPDEVTSQIDRESLRQALRDFEIANARVVDLTARLTEMHEKVRHLQHLLSVEQVENAAVRERAARLESDADAARSALATVHGSRSFRAAQLSGRIARKVLGA
jgi:predicted  nucleic acid-binding Zn-ribbon protein